MIIIDQLYVFEGSQLLQASRAVLSQNVVSGAAGAAVAVISAGSRAGKASPSFRFYEMLQNL